VRLAPWWRGIDRDGEGSDKEEDDDDDEDDDDGPKRKRRKRRMDEGAIVIPPSVPSSTRHGTSAGRPCPARSTKSSKTTRVS
jgi:hypothetical protein